MINIQFRWLQLSTEPKILQYRERLLIPPTLSVWSDWCFVPTVIAPVVKGPDSTFDPNNPIKTD